MTRPHIISIAAGLVCAVTMAGAASAGGNGTGKKPEFKTRVEKGNATQVAHAAKIRESYLAARAAGTTHTTEGLRSISHPDGSVSLPLQGRFLEESVAVRDARGKLAIRCVDDAGRPAGALEEK